MQAPSSIKRVMDSFPQELPPEAIEKVEPQRPITDEEQSVKNLAKALSIVVKLGRRLIRDSGVKAQLNESHGAAFWETYFRIVLAQVLGTEVPSNSTHLIAEETTLRSKLSAITNEMSVELEKAKNYFKNWAQPPKKMWYCVAQFWNADAARSSSFVAHSLPGQGDTLVVSDLNWNFMREVNHLNVGSIETVRVGGDKTTREFVNSIGNFVMWISDQKQNTCSIFILVVGPTQGDPAYSKITHPSLTISEAFVRKIASHLSALMQKGEARTAFECFSQQGRDEQLKLIRSLAENADLWQDEQHAFVQYFVNEYQVAAHGDRDIFAIRMLILNNLFVVRKLLNLILAEDITKDSSKDWKQGWHCQYCIPVWHLSTSYIFLTTALPLSDDELSCFENFAERIMASAWAEDSVRKHEVDRIDILSRSRTAARASILARNFSHVTGSHVISNPDFAFALAGSEAWGAWRAQLAGHTRNFVQAFENYQKVPGIHWRDAERTLARMSEAAESSGGALLEETRRFHHYLQGRFDFIARAIDQTHDRQEPVFFIADLMEGFLSQTAFLGTLVSDLGLPLPRVQFKVILPDKTEFQTKWSLARLVDGAASNVSTKTEPGLRTHSWQPIGNHTEEINKHDVLLGVPGGMISCQAFYSLLENIIRNSVKYGSDKDTIFGNSIGGSNGAYVMTLNLFPDQIGRYSLHIFDNCSGLGEDQKALKRVLEKLRPDILNESGRQQADGLGLQEMIICAESLLSERAKHELERENQKLPKEQQKKALRLLAPPECKGRLTYELTISRPVFVGIWAKQPASTCSVGMVRRTHSIGEVIDGFHKKQASGFSAHLFAIDGDLEPLDVTVQVRKHHTELPYRLFVVCRDSNAKERWKTAIRQAENEELDPLPAGRLRVVVDASLSRRLAIIPLPANNRPALDVQSFDEMQALTIACYDAWLRAWKGERKDGASWDLWLGFDRGRTWVEDTWQQLLRGFDNYLARTVFAGDTPRPHTVRVLVREGTAGRSPGKIISSSTQPEDLSAYWKAELAAPVCDKRALVFDNHGQCFTEVIEADQEWNPRRSSRFYQSFGSGTAELYRHLSTPPTHSFGLAYFIYSLVESCLANIAVVDERVAADLIFVQGRAGVACTENEFKKNLASHQKTAIFPLFSFKPFISDEQIAKNPKLHLAGIYTPIHRQALRKLLPLGQPGVPNLIREGLQFDTRGNGTRAHAIVSNSEGGFDLLRLLATSEQEDCPVNDCPVMEQCAAIPMDAIVIHEGVVDLVANNELVKWEKELTQKLWKIAPAVIRTSGRGRHTKHFDTRLPFIEFNEVSSAVLTSRNKYSFVRSLFGASGQFAPQRSQKQATD